VTDPSLAKGERDTHSVTKAGVPLAARIDGVKTRSMPNHVDHRGTVFEIFEDDLEFWETPIVYAYQFSIRPGMVKGWGLHEQKKDGTRSSPARSSSFCTTPGRSPRRTASCKRCTCRTARSAR
jgi:hypothetical protein